MADETAALVAELRALEAKATPASDLNIERYRHGGGRVWTTTGYGTLKGGSRQLVADFYYEEERELWFAARNALTDLLSALEQAQRERDARALMDPREREPELARAIQEQAAEIARLERERDEARDKLGEYEHYVALGRNEQHEHLVGELEAARERIATLEAALRSGLEVCEVALDMTFAPWATHAKKLLAGAALRAGKETL